MEQWDDSDSATGALPPSWVHPEWVARLGGSGESGRRTLSLLLGDRRMRAAAEKLATRHGVILRLGECGPEHLDGATCTALAALSHAPERLILLAGHVALHARIRALVFEAPDSVAPAGLDRALARLALDRGVAVPDPAPGDDIWAGGWRLFATWLVHRPVADRAYLRLALPVKTGRTLRDLRPYPDPHVAVAAVDALLAHDRTMDAIRPREDTAA